MKKRSSSRLSVDTDDGNNTSGGSLVRQLSLSRSPSMRRYNEGMQRLKDTFRNHKKTAALDTVSEESMMSPPPSPLLVHTASKESGDSSKPLTPHATVESLLYDVDIDEFESEDDETLNLPTLSEIDKIDKDDNNNSDDDNDVIPDSPTRKVPQIKWKTSVRAIDRPPSEIEGFDNSDKTKDKDEFRWPRKVEIEDTLLKQGTKRYALGMMQKPWQKRYVCVGDGFICWHKKKDADRPSGRLRLVHYKCSEPIRVKNNRVSLSRMMSKKEAGQYQFTLVPDNLERRELKLIAMSKESAARWTGTIRKEIMSMFRDAKIPRVRLNSGYEDISPSQTFETEKQAHESIKEKYRSRIGGKEQKELGQGQFARVWLVERIKDQKLFACKNFILNDMVSGKSMEGSAVRADRMNVLDEIEILKKLDHPNIVKLIDVYIVKSKCVYMFLSYCDGGTLEELINNSPGGFLKESQAIAITRELLSAVWYIHSKGICHRDIKLENILVRKKTREKKFPFSIVLCDFGISKLGLEPTELMSLKCGSLLFTAPEILGGTFYTNSCDIWACGVTIHWMLTGHAPFGHSAMQSRKNEKVIEAAIQKEIRSGEIKESALFRRISEPAKKFVRTLLRINPAKRSSADEALQDPWLTHAGLKSEVPATLLEPLIRSVHRLCHSNLLKQAALIVIAHRIDLAQMTDAHTLFSMMDVDGSGRVELDEFEAVFAKIGIPKDIAKSSFKLIDLDNSGCLRFSEFAAFFIETKVFDDDMLHEVFDVLDGGGKGFVTTADIDRMLDEETSEEDADMKITFEEFKHVMKADNTSSKEKPTTHDEAKEEDEENQSGRRLSEDDKAMVATSFAEACTKSRQFVNKTRKSSARLRFRSRVRAVQAASILLRGSEKKKSNTTTS